MKKNQIGTYMLIIAIVASFIQCKPSSDENLKPKLDAYFKQEVINKYMDTIENNNPGLSIIITKENTILYTANYGAADIKNSTPITENTVFDIASTTKQFTGMAIAMLEENGDINMNDNISTYLPEIPEALANITIDQLIHHTSGVRDWPTLLALQGTTPMSTITNDNIYNTLMRQESLNFAPGSEFSYSNSNYNLLAKIIETITETEFETWMTDNIFVPLGMENTYFENTLSEGKSLADSYVKIKSGYQAFPNNLYAPGSSSLKSTTTDMAKWITNFYTKSVGGDNVLAKTTHQGHLNNNKPVKYGYGLYITDVKNKPVYTHDGSWAGYKTGTVYFPDKNVGIVILSNVNTMNPNKIMADLADILFDTHDTMEKEETVAAEQEINDKFFALCAGRYQQVDDEECFLTFFKKDNEYFANVYGKDFKLYAKSDSILFVKEASAEMVFHLQDGKVNSHTLHQNGKSFLALKVEEDYQEEEAIINYDEMIGDYYSKELDMKYIVKYENEELKIECPIFQTDLTLTHSKDLTFTCNSGLVQSISFMEENGTYTNLVVNNPRAKNLKFAHIQ